MTDVQPIPTDKRFQDLTGRTFGRWTVLSYAGKFGGGRSKRHNWNVQCECGKVAVSYGGNLTSGKSNGCIRCHARESGRKYRRVSSYYPEEYQTWHHMKARCYRTSNVGFADYGGRGIVVCDRWRNSFVSFLADIGRRMTYSSIDRINVNGNYSCGHCPMCRRNNWPANCRWSDPSTQSNNTRATRYVSINGKSVPVSFATSSEVSSSLIRDRLDRGWDGIAATTIPPRKMTSRGVVSCFGKTQTIYAWSKETGLSYNCILRRLLKGMDPEAALTTPSRIQHESSSKALGSHMSR